MGRKREKGNDTQQRSRPRSHLAHAVRMADLLFVLRAHTHNSGNICKIKRYKFSLRNLSFNSTVTFSSSATPLDFPHSLNFNSRALSPPALSWHKTSRQKQRELLFLISPPTMTSHIPFNELLLCLTWEEIQSITQRRYVEARPACAQISQKSTFFH